MSYVCELVNKNFLVDGRTLYIFLRQSEKGVSFSEFFVRLGNKPINCKGSTGDDLSFQLSITDAIEFIKKLEQDGCVKNTLRQLNEWRENQIEFILQDYVIQCDKVKRLERELQELRAEYSPESNGVTLIELDSETVSRFKKNEFESGVLVDEFEKILRKNGIRKNKSIIYNTLSSMKWTRDVPGKMYHIPVDFAIENEYLTVRDEEQTQMSYRFIRPSILPKGMVILLKRFGISVPDDVVDLVERSGNK